MGGEKKVTLTKGFWLAESEVTQAAYERVVRKNPSAFKGPDLPADNVTWYDAAGYCKHVEARLPTEAEWEYAARAGTKGELYGSLDEVAWYGGNSGGQPHPVRQKMPNGFGLYDMLGNATEWTNDWYQDGLAGGTDPQGPPSGDDKVLRGATWSEYAQAVRASARGRAPRNATNRQTGFRCAADWK
jgi:formylglycine-generating enzyme required for sulfatase activity